MKKAQLGAASCILALMGVVAVSCIDLDPDEVDSASQNVSPGQVVICHIPPGNEENPQTIEVGLAAVPAHMEHGDYLGQCQECAAEGAWCDEPGDCCSEWCYEGVCVAVCGLTGEPCSDGGECCSGQCSAEGECVDVTETECTPPGEACFDSGECCVGECSDQGLCAVGTTECTATGAACLEGGECCSGECYEGECVEECTEDRLDCTEDGQCCSGQCYWYQCVQACTDDGGCCYHDGDCCSGACNKGICAPPW